MEDLYILTYDNGKTLTFHTNLKGDIISIPEDFNRFLGEHYQTLLAFIYNNYGHYHLKRQI